MEVWPIKAVNVAPISRKLEIAQNAKSCSRPKKLLEIRIVAKKMLSNLWQGLLLLTSHYARNSGALPPSTQVGGWANPAAEQQSI